MDANLKALCETPRSAGISMTVKEFHEGVDFFEFSGIATTPKTDLVGDIVDPMGAEFALPIKLLSKHDSHKPLGNVVFAKVTKEGIPYRARIPLVKEEGLVKQRIEEAIHEIKYGLVTNVSIGFKAIAEFVELLKTGGLHFKRWKWLELSLAPIPANDEATITAFKSLDTRIKAALGRNDPSVDAGDNSRARDQRPKGSKMESIEELQTRRDEIATRMKELKTETELTGSDRTEFDSLKAELRKVDSALDDERAMETALKGAVPVSPAIITSQQSGSRARNGKQDETKKTADEDKGIAFAQYVKVRRFAKANGIDPRNLADQLRGRIDERVPRMLKAAVTAGGTASGNWGEQLVGDETGAVADFVDYLRRGTILGKFGQNGVPDLRRVPVRVPLVTQTSGGNAQWVGEGKAKPLTSFAFTRTHLDPLKIAAITVVSDELLKFSSPSADRLLRDSLAAAVRERADIDFVDPAKAAVNGVSPASITNGVTAITPSGTGDAADIRVDIKRAMQAFNADNNPLSSGVFIMPTGVAVSLSMMMNALGQPEFPGVNVRGGTLAGIPVIVSDFMDNDTNGGDIILMNAQDVYFWDEGGVEVSTSDQATIEMSDDPENESGTQVNMFQTNRVAFRAEWYVDWMKRRSSSVQLISSADWGNA